jgi:hypothetical protein
MSQFSGAAVFNMYCCADFDLWVFCCQILSAWGLDGVRLIMMKSGGGRSIRYVGIHFGACGRRPTVVIEVGLTSRGGGGRS